MCTNCYDEHFMKHAQFTLTGNKKDVKNTGEDDSA